MTYLCTSACTDAGTSSQNMTDWIKVYADNKFSLLAPPETKFHQQQGMDSFVGVFSNKNFKMKFDYGLYSDPLDDRGSKTEINVDGKPAWIVRSSTPGSTNKASNFIGIHFPEVEQTFLGTTKLTIITSPEKEEDYEAIEKIFRSIKFINSSNQ